VKGSFVLCPWFLVAWSVPGPWSLVLVFRVNQKRVWTESVGGPVDPGSRTDREPGTKMR
jgi:hypothetical protein